jgi:hypothetical protein
MTQFCSVPSATDVELAGTYSDLSHVRAPVRLDQLRGNEIIQLSWQLTRVEHLSNGQLRLWSGTTVAITASPGTEISVYRPRPRPGTKITTGARPNIKSRHVGRQKK